MALNSGSLFTSTMFSSVLFPSNLFGTDGGGTSPSVPAEPENTALPVIAGTLQEGRTLNVSNGTWLNSPESFAYQWHRADDEAITDATASTYELTAAEVGAGVYCVVTATNDEGSVAAQSATTASIATAAPNAPTGLILTAIDGGFEAQWTEPVDNGYAIESYTVQYKLDADMDYTDYLVEPVGGDLPEFAEITGLDAEEYTVRVFATNAFYDSDTTATDTVTPLANTTVQSAIPLVGGKGLVAYWSAKQHDGTTTWANAIEDPADGEDQTDYDIEEGGTAPTWDGQKFVMNNSARWNGVNTPFVESLHQTTAGNEWTWFAYAKTNATNGAFDSMFGTADADTDTGVSIRQDSGGRLKIDQRTGTRVTAEPSTNATTSTLYRLVIRRDQDAGETSFAINADTFEVETHTFNANTSAPTYNYCVGAEGNNGNPMDTSTELYCMGLINRAITEDELAALNDAIEAEFTPPDPTVPGQVDSVNAVGSDTEVHLAWRLQDFGGVAANTITYQVQYKETSSGTWLDFGSPTANTFATVTGLTNSTSYDCRVAAINSVGTGTPSAAVAATPVVNGTAPYDTQYFKITLPVNSSGLRTGSALEILQPDFNTYDSAWFGRGDGYFDFYVPDGGATTATATYCRTELRHLTNFPWNESCEDTVRFSCHDMLDNEKMIVHQIHGIDNPWVKATYTHKDNGTGLLRYLVKPNYGDSDVSITALTNIEEGDIITSRIVYTYLGSNTGRLDFYVNGSFVGTSALNRSAGDGDGGAAYWKRGAYYQSVSRAGNIARVRHYTQSGQYVPTFTPASISDLELWLDASDTATITQAAGLVSQWDDKSGNDNHATQGTGSKQPTTGIRDLNGLNGLDFNAANDQALDLSAHIANLQLVNNANTVFIVARKDLAASNFDMFLGGENSSAANRLLIGQNGAFFSFFSHNATRIDFGDDENPHIFLAERAGATSGNANFYIDGGTPNSNTITSGENIEYLAIGAVNADTGEYDLDGAIYEIIIYMRALSDTEKNLVGSYLNVKWGLTWNSV
jgi:hypothetical protein